jgi:dTDP-4-amino-4,6-dideoxygalactose transaminase
LHLYVIRLRLDRLARSHSEVFRLLRESGIGVNLHYIPVHLQPWYARMGFRQGDYPEAERYYAEAISLPMFAALTDAQQDQVVAALTKAVSS